MADESLRAGMVGTDLHHAMEANTAVRLRIEAALHEVEQITHALTRATEMRHEVYRLERSLVERTTVLGEDLTRIAAGVADIDDTITRSARALRDLAASHTATPEGQHSPAGPALAAAMAAAMAGTDAMTALASHSHDGLLHARRAVVALSEELRPQPAHEDLHRYARSASEHIADAGRQATRRGVATEVAAQHAMTLAAILDSHPTPPAQANSRLPGIPARPPMGR